MQHFTALENDQARQLIDAQQLFAIYGRARAQLASDFVGSMRWRDIAGAQYLVKKVAGREMSLGRHTPETQTAFDAFTAEKERLRKLKASAGARLKAMDRINVAYRIGRIPIFPPGSSTLLIVPGLWALVSSWWGRRRCLPMRPWPPSALTRASPRRRISIS